MTNLYLWSIAVIAGVGVALVPIIEHHTPKTTTIALSDGASISVTMSKADMVAFCENAQETTKHLGPVDPESPCGKLLSR